MAVKKVSSSFVTFYCENELIGKLNVKAKEAKLTIEDYIITVLEKDTADVEAPKPKSRARKAAAVVQE